MLKQIDSTELFVTKDLDGLIISGKTKQDLLKFGGRIKKETGIGIFLDFTSFLESEESDKSIVYRMVPCILATYPGMGNERSWDPYLYDIEVKVNGRTLPNKSFLDDAITEFLDSTISRMNDTYYVAQYKLLAELFGGRGRSFSEEALTGRVNLIGFRGDPDQIVRSVARAGFITKRNGTPHYYLSELAEAIKPCMDLFSALPSPCPIKGFWAVKMANEALLIGHKERKMFITFEKVARREPKIIKAYKGAEPVALEDAVLKSEAAKAEAAKAETEKQKKPVLIKFEEDNKPVSITVSVTDRYDFSKTAEISLTKGATLRDLISSNKEYDESDVFMRSDKPLKMDDVLVNGENLVYAKLNSEIADNTACIKMLKPKTSHSSVVPVRASVTPVRDFSELPPIKKISELPPVQKISEVQKSENFLSRFFTIEEAEPAVAALAGMYIKAVRERRTDVQNHLISLIKEISLI